MSGPWYGFATLAIAVVIRWLIYNDTGPTRLKLRRTAPPLVNETR
jgi:hypothetical protein